MREKLNESHLRRGLVCAPPVPAIVTPRVKKRRATREFVSMWLGTNATQRILLPEEGSAERTRVSQQRRGWYNFWSGDSGETRGMSQPAIVVHYHELWLKGRNRRFFVSKLASAVRLGLEGIPLDKIERPNDRLVVRLKEGASLEDTLSRLEKIPGI